MSDVCSVEAIFKCNKCNLNFSVLIEGISESDVEFQIGSDSVWFCPRCKSYDTYVDEVFEQ